MSDAAETEGRRSVVRADDQPIRVLHVDDETDLVELAATYIERARDRMTVLAEPSASDALDRLDDDTVDCIVSDYDMPEMTGLEFLKAVRAEYPDLPFILYTGKGSEEIASEAISAGVTDYLQKEVGTEQYEVLANRIEHAVAEQRTEEALAESERVLSTLMSNVPGMVYRCRNEEGWPMAFVSDGSLDLVGYDPAALTDGDVSFGDDVIHPGDRDDVWNAVQAAVEERRPFELEYRVRTSEGETRWVREQGRAVDTDDGTVILEGVITDITGRKASEQELQTERDRLSALFENTEAAIVYYEFVEDRPIVRDVNAAFAETFGYDADEIIGEDIDEYVTPPQHREQAERINERARAGERLLNEVERETADGLRTFRVRSIPLQPGESGEEGWIVYTDITEQKEREQRLQQAERRYRRVAEQNLFGIYIIQDGLIRYANPKAAEIFGYEPAEMVDEMTAFDITAEADHDRLEENIRKREQGDLSEMQYELTGIRKDGTQIEYEVHSGVIEYEGEPALLGAVIDITERKERERELEQYETMVDTVADGVYALNTDLEFITVNDGMVELTGYDRAELVGESAAMLLDEADVEQARASRDQLRTGERADVTNELTLYCADGEQIPCEVRFRELTDEDGTYRGTAGVVRDITERKERERELRRQNERLEEFAHLVSHDIKGPLNVAETRAELLAETGETVHYRKIQQAHDRMASLVDDVLDLARHGQTVRDPSPVPLAAVARQAWTVVDEAAATLAVDADATVMADRSRLQSLLENLFRNSVEHAGPGVTVRVGTLPDDAGFFVADEGPGIPADEREQVFEAGYTDATDGTGFGLSIVAEIAAAHGWTVVLTDAGDTAPDRDADATGAQFSITGVSFADTG